jgi:HD-GYP domain-containing protein (c-di-GMP phosphodiesterase class II)
VERADKGLFDNDYTTDAGTGDMSLLGCDVFPYTHTPNGGSREPMSRTPHGDDPARRKGARATSGGPPPSSSGEGSNGSAPKEPEVPKLPEVSADQSRAFGRNNTDEADAIVRRIDAARTPCQELLQEAIQKLNYSSGVLYSVDAPRRVSVLGSVSMSEAADLPLTERAALNGLEASRPLVATGRVGEAEREELLVVPCQLQGDVVSVLVLARPAGSEATVEEDLAKLGSTLSIALAADRARIHFTLERRMTEAEAIRRQLDAYAVDLRSVYLSERARSDELGHALVELEETYEATVRGLAIAVESKDEYTGGHLFRVTRYGMTMTAIVAPAHRDDPQFEYGFLLHDVGKLTVPDAILAKSGALTEDEWEFIRAHPASGRTILERIPFLSEASEIVFCHHERWDGKGFPQGLAGDEIPLGARIFPIADAFDAMTTSRPYREAVEIEAAREELVRGSGTQFWPDAVDAFMSIPIDELEEVRRDTPGASGW